MSSQICYHTALCLACKYACLSDKVQHLHHLHHLHLSIIILHAIISSTKYAHVTTPLLFLIPYSYTFPSNSSPPSVVALSLVLLPSVSAYSRLRALHYIESTYCAILKNLLGLSLILLSKLWHFEPTTLPISVLIFLSLAPEPFPVATQATSAL